MLTGLYPDRHGATDRRRGLAPGLPTLAEALRDAGFETVAFTDGGYVHPSFGLDRGFQVYDGAGGSQDPEVRRDLPRGGATPDDRVRELFDRGVAWLGRRDADAPPFLLFLHTFALHDYFKAHPSAAERAGPRAGDDPDRYRGCLVGAAACDAEEWERLRELYQASLEIVDEGLGRVLAALEASGELDSTLVVRYRHP